MTHSWRAYAIAKDLTELLIRSSVVDRDKELPVRGIIQIRLEEKQVK